MNIIIVGAGSVGSAICAQLAKEGHDVTLVDKNIEALNELSLEFDVFGVEGNAADVSVLRKAGAEKARLLIAATNDDSVNILCCIAAKKLGTHHTVARISTPDYSGLIQLMRSEINLSLTLNPESTAAKELYRMLRFPSAAKIDTVCRGKVELVQFVLGDDSSLCGKTLNDLRGKLNIRFLVCSVLRGNEVYIPSGHFVLQAGDVICVTAPEEEIAVFFKTIGAYKQPVKNVFIVGGGRTTYYLETLLEKTNIRSTIIEKDKAACRVLAEEFPSCNVICGNPTKQELLLAEGLERTDAFLALSDVDEDNAIVSMFAKTLGVKKVVTLINTLSHIDFFKSVGIDGVVSPKSAMATYVLRYVRALANSLDSEIESLHKLMDGRVEALEFIVKGDIDGVTEIPLRELRAREGVLIACIVHRDRIIIPSGDDIISAGDTVVIITTSGKMNNIKDILR